MARTSIFNGIFESGGDVPTMSYPTWTMYDILTGRMQRGIDGKWYLRGGIGNYITSCFGLGNCFKSTIFDGLVTRMITTQGADCLVMDTEGSKTRERIITCADDFKDMVPGYSIYMGSGTTMTIGEFLKKLYDVAGAKWKTRKDWMVETPFLDHDGNPINAWIPTVVYIDSFSELMSASEDALIEKKGLDDGQSATAFMKDGGQKTIFTRHVRRLCELYGLCIVAVAHVGGNINIGEGPGQTKKKIHTMKQDESLKGVGSKFYYLTKNLIKIDKPVPMINKGSGGPEYGGIGATEADLFEVYLETVRCKTNLSKLRMPMIISQSQGMLTDVSNYHYLRKRGYDGLSGNKVTNSSALLPDVKFTRNTMREKSKNDRRVRRALEICAEIAFMQDTWPVMGQMPEQFKWSIAKIADELLNKKETPKIDDILESRGRWLPKDMDDGREHLSSWDVLELLNKK